MYCLHSITTYKQPKLFSCGSVLFFDTNEHLQVVLSRHLSAIGSFLAKPDFCLNTLQDSIHIQNFAKDKNEKSVFKDSVEVQKVGVLTDKQNKGFDLDLFYGCVR